MRTIMLMMAGWLLCMAASAQKETRIYQFDKPLYGAAFYAEYTPTNRLDEDIRLMKEAHLTVVRVGESTWSLFEPQDGQFEFAWMDRIIDALHKAGNKVGGHLCHDLLHELPAKGVFDGVVLLEF